MQKEYFRISAENISFFHGKEEHVLLKEHARSEVSPVTSLGHLGAKSFL